MKTKYSKMPQNFPIGAMHKMETDITEEEYQAIIIAAAKKYFTADMFDKFVDEWNPIDRSIGLADSVVLYAVADAEKAMQALSNGRCVVAQIHATDKPFYCVGRVGS